MPPNCAPWWKPVRRAGMLPVGLVNGTAATDTLAREVDMPVLAQFRATTKSPPVVHAAPTARGGNGF